MDSPSGKRTQRLPSRVPRRPPTSPKKNAHTLTGGNIAIRILAYGTGFFQATDAEGKREIGWRFLWDCEPGGSFSLDICITTLYAIHVVTSSDPEVFTWRENTNTS